jgi:spore coat polysaccharide biosynthesis protein SpsF
MPGIIAMIQARMGSTRLPGKVLLPLRDNWPVLGFVIDKIIAVNEIKPLIDKIIVVTTQKTEDNKIEEFCKNYNVACFRGEEVNVLKRYYDCAKENKADWILRITADCPLVNPFMLYGLLKKEPRCEYQALAFNSKGIPGGWDAELFSFKELERVYKLGPDEHVSTRMRKKDEDLLDYGTDFDFTGIKYDLDTIEDYERIKKIMELM